MAISEREQRTLWLTEYAEAGAACRSNSALVRNGLALVAAVNAGLIGFIAAGAKRDTFVLFVLLGLGTVLSGVALLSTHRLFKRHATYMRRARELEVELKFDLYSRSHREDDARTLGGRELWTGLAGVMLIAYFVLIGYFVCNCAVGSNC